MVEKAEELRKEGKRKKTRLHEKTQWRKKSDKEKCCEREQVEQNQV